MQSAKLVVWPEVVEQIKMEPEWDGETEPEAGSLTAGLALWSEDVNSHLQDKGPVVGQCPTVSSTEPSPRGSFERKGFHCEGAVRGHWEMALYSFLRDSQHILAYHGLI